MCPQNAVCKLQRNGLEFPPFVNVSENFHGIRHFATGFDFTASHDIAIYHDVATEIGIVAENDFAIEPHRSAPVYH